LTIPSLKIYLLVEQDTPQIKVYRRNGDQFQLERYSSLDAVIPLPELGIELPLSEVYAGLTLSPEPVDEQQEKR
jgi:hypothetical protein